MALSTVLLARVPINQRSPDSRTLALLFRRDSYYVKAMDLAFEITAKSDGLGLTANCSRVYVFLSDGEPSDDIDDFVTTVNANKREHDMFFLIALGSGVGDTLKNAACDIDGVFISVEDSDTSALTKALGAYYQYLAMGNMIAEVQPTRWSEPYYSIPDIYGLVTSAVTPVYDKRQEPWTMIGVAAVDLPMCELTEAAAAAGWTDDVADPSEVLTRQGCACADSYTYEGRTYTGCTTYDWATAWCGTVDSDCGICDEQVQGGANGCWDECDFSGSVEGKVRAALQEASSQCFPTVVQEEGLEVLRGTETCTATVLTDEWTSLIVTAKPNYGAVGEYDWVNTASGEYDEYPCDGIFNDKTCEVCLTEMTPTCAVGECQSALDSWEEGGACASIEDSWEDVEAIIGIIVGVVIPVVLIIGCIVIVQKRMQQGGQVSDGRAQQAPQAQQPGMPVQQPPMYAQPGVMAAPVMGSPVMGAPMMGAPMMGAPVMGAPVMGAQPGMMGAPVMGAAPVQNRPIQARVVAHH